MARAWPARAAPSWARRASGPSWGTQKSGLSIESRVCSMGCPRWCACSWMSGSGRGSNQRWAWGNAPGVLGVTIATSWKRYCGGGVQARRGEIFPATLDPGRPCSTGSTVGQARVSGSVCSKHFVKTLTMSGTASTARSIALISTQPEQKGALGARHRSLSWWPDDQGSLGRRRSGPAVGFRDH